MEDYKIEEILRDNDIDAQRCELFYQFIKRLSYNVFKTYLGDDSMSKEDYRGHFHWCVKKTSEEFTIERVDFNKGRIEEYFFKLFNDVFYKSSYKGEKLEDIVFEMWEKTFFSRTKLINVLLMVEIYQIMNIVFSEKLDYINIK